MNAALRFSVPVCFQMSSLPICPVCQIDMLLSSEQQAILHPELQTLECGKCHLVFTRPITREDVARRAVRHAHDVQTDNALVVQAVKLPLPHQSNAGSDGRRPGR